MPTDHPYPTPFEMLRYLLKSFDIKLPKKDKKRLDDMAAERTYDSRKFNAELEQCFSAVANKYIGRKATVTISKNVVQFLDDYLNHIAGKIPADGLSRETLLKILIKTKIKDQLVEFAMKFHEEIGGPHPIFWFSSDSITVDAIFSWLSENEPQWESHLASLNKERRDMLATWRKGHDLPSSQSIYLFSQSDAKGEKGRNLINWDLIKPLLFLARSIDFIKRSKVGCALLNEVRLALLGSDNNTDLGDEVLLAQSSLSPYLSTVKNEIALIQHELMRTKKNKLDSKQYRSAIEKIRNLYTSSKNLPNVDYWIDWLDARWHVFSGDLDTANDLYKEAFEKAVFTAGENQKYIVEEAFVVAASQSKPDKIFLKQLKWTQINFGYDIPSISKSTPSQKFSDTIENWEIDLWRSNFNLIFPKSGYFPGTEYALESNIQGPLFFPDPSKIKPDYRHPNRTIKVGETWQRAMPQLVWFALNEDIETCKKLIDRGANVNVQSEVGDTPILLAIEALNVTEVPLRSLNNELFDIISVQSHTSEILNTRTQKKHLLPITSAVETGSPDIIEKLLKLGADSNGRGSTDEQTALNLCLHYIGMIKNPKGVWDKCDALIETPKGLDSIRRYTAGKFGFSQDHLRKYLRDSKNDDLMNKCRQVIREKMEKRILSKMTIPSMRNIASLLMSYGADVNAEHLSPLKGYTPLMLAAELDEQKIFDAMLVAGGDINKKYIDPSTGREISLLDIANYFNSKNVMQSLDDISTYAKFH